MCQASFAQWDWLQQQFWPAEVDPKNKVRSKNQSKNIEPPEKDLTQNTYMHVVDEHARMLSTVSILLYGTTRFFDQIAQWNQLKPPYKISLGQKLILRKQPTVSINEGRLLVRKMWAKQLGSIFANLRSREIASDEEIAFEAAVKLYEKQEYHIALKTFSRIHKESPDNLTNRIYELKTLQALSRKKKVKALVQELLEEHPKMKEQLELIGVYKNP